MEFEKGITLLNSIEITKQSVFFDIVSVLLIFLGVALFISGLYFKLYKSNLKYLLIAIIGAILVIIPCSTDVVVNGKPTGKYKYQVIIDDSVSFNEFMDKYEIIDRQGKIYTIKLKEEEDEIN